MKLYRILSVLIAAAILFCCSIETIAGSLSAVQTSEKTTDDTEVIHEETSSSVDKDEPAADSETSDGLNSQAAEEYIKDGTLEVRQEFMQNIASINTAYYSTLSVDAGNSINVSDIASIIPCSAPENMPSIGTAGALVFLVDFPDSPHDAANTKELAMQQFFGQENSLSSFYYSSSYEKLTITGDVQDWYTAEHNKDYYVKKGIHTLYQEVLNAFDSTVDYSKYDADANGYIDGLYLHFAGESSGWGSAFWSYVTSIPAATYDGISIGSRVCLLHELNTETIIHETGHLLGLQDYYSYTIKTALGNNHCWVGTDDVMINGTGEHNAVSKMLLGWISQVKLFNTDGDNDLDDFSKTGDAAIIYPFGEAVGDCFFVLQNHSGVLKMLRINAKLDVEKNGKKHFAYSNMYGEVPFVELIADLGDGETASPYDSGRSTHYYNEKTKVNTFSGVSVKTTVTGNGLVKVKIKFEKAPTKIDPPVIQTTASINQVTATVDFSVPFSIDKQIVPYLTDKNGNRIAKMNVTAIYNDGEGYYVDKASCVLKVASYREWGFDGYNEITVGSDQDYLLTPGEKYTIVIPKGTFKTVMGDIDEIRTDITADTTADREAKYKTISSFDRCSEFITLNDGRAAYAYVDEQDINRPLILVLISEDGTEEKHILIPEKMSGYVGICQLSDNSIAVSVKSWETDLTLVCKYDLSQNAVTAQIDLGECVDSSKLSSFDNGFYIYNPISANSKKIIRIDNDLTSAEAILPELEAPNDYVGYNKFVLGENIIYIAPETDTVISSGYAVMTNKKQISLYTPDGEIIAKNAMIGLDDAAFLGAVVNQDNNIVLAYYNLASSSVSMMVFDMNMHLLETVTPKLAYHSFSRGLQEYSFKCVSDGYFLSYSYVHQYNPRGLVGMFTTETYEQGLLLNSNFEVVSSFDVSYTASAAALGSTGNRFVAGDEYGYYTADAELGAVISKTELYSDKYTVDNTIHTITSVPENTTVENLLKFIRASQKKSRYELRYTHAERNRPVGKDEILSCNYELLVYNKDNTKATVYTFPELPGDWESAFKIENNGNLYGYTATDTVLTTPDFVESIYFDSIYGNDMSCVESLTTAAVIGKYGLPNLKELTLKDGCTRVGDNGFSYCRELKKVVIPSTVKVIANWAFQNCSSLEEVIIPASVTRIGNGAFSNPNKEILKMTYLGTEEQWNKIDFRCFTFDDAEGSKYGFYDWKNAFGDCLVFAGSGMYEAVPDFAVEKAVINKEGTALQFKADKSLFDNEVYVQPYLEVVYNSKVYYISEYETDENYYVFTLVTAAAQATEAVSLLSANDEVYCTLYATNRGTLCVSKTEQYSVSELADIAELENGGVEVTQDASEITGTGSIVFTAAAAGKELTYKWSGVLPDGVELSGTDTAQLTVTVASVLYESFIATLVCTVTDAYGTTVQSSPVTVLYVSTRSVEDINNDGKVNIQDLFIIKLCLKGKYTSDSTYYRMSDITGDGKVNISDVFKLKLCLKGM